MHGAGGRDRTSPQKPETATGPVNERNRIVKMGRRAARAAVQDVPQEVEREFARQWAALVPEPDHERFLLMLWARIEGRLDTRAWIDAQKAVGLLDEG